MKLLYQPRTLLVLALLLVYWGIIFRGTHTPGPGALQVGTWDKVVHFSAYLGLALLLCLAGTSFFRSPRRLYFGVIALAALYGMVDELTQLLVPGRTAELLDWLADVAGAALGTCL